MFDEILSILDKYRDEYKEGADSKKDEKPVEVTSPSVGEPQDNEVTSQKNEINSQEKEESSQEDKSDGGEKGPLVDESSESEKINDKNRTVRFLNPMPRFLGPELEEYGPFDEEDIVSLPSRVVDVLVKKERAEEIIVQD